MHDEKGAFPADLPFFFLSFFIQRASLPKGRTLSSSFLEKLGPRSSIPGIDSPLLPLRP